MNGHQPGDADKLAAILFQITEEQNPPVHLLMGPDAYQVVKEKRKADDEEFEIWKQVTESTNLDNVKESKSKWRED